MRRTFWRDETLYYALVWVMTTRSYTIAKLRFVLSMYKLHLHKVGVVNINKSYCSGSEFLFDNIDIIYCFSILAQKLNSNSPYGGISFM